MDALPSVLSERGPIIASVVFLLSAVFLTSRLWAGERVNTKIPLVGGELGGPAKRRAAYSAQAKDLYQRGYKAFKNQVFRLTTPDGDQYVMPTKFLEELRRIPDDHVDINKGFQRTNHMRYTKLGGNPRHTEILLNVIRADLTRSLNRINTRLTEETNRTVTEIFGDNKDWTPVVVYQRLLPIVAIISGNIFLGPDLCRSESYLHHSIHYTVDLFTAISKLSQWQWWTRPIGQYFIPELKNVFEHRRKAREFLLPVIQERRRLMREGLEVPDDMLQWMLAKSDDYGLTDDDMSEVQLNLSLAAIHTTTATITLALYDLAVRPELIAELRNEVKTSLEANGGIMTTHALYEMKLLDSFMKESQRMNPGNLVRFSRYVDKPLTLSDGTYIPAGVMIHAPHASIVQDPACYPRPDEFNARRFHDLRTSSTPDPLKYSTREQYQFVTATKEFMAFGYGRHACPGRFFAANEIKLILSRLLLEYDLRMPDGLTERYPNMVMGIDALPDPTKELMLKRVST